MSTPSWVIPIASLSAIIAVALIFFFWWFPRTWVRGTQQEMQILAARLDEERAMKQRNLDAGGTADEAEDADVLKKPPKVFIYTPPAYATY